MTLVILFNILPSLSAHTWWSWCKAWRRLALSSRYRVLSCAILAARLSSIMSSVAEEIHSCLTKRFMPSVLEAAEQSAVLSSDHIPSAPCPGVPGPLSPACTARANAAEVVGFYSFSQSNFGGLCCPTLGLDVRMRSVATRGRWSVENSKPR